jgi:hypothetical protein
MKVVQVHVDVGRSTVHVSEVWDDLANDPVELRYNFTGVQKDVETTSTYKSRTIKHV